MEDWSWWDIGLLAFAGYWAVAALLRLMLAYRDAEISEVKRQMAEYQQQKKEKRKRSPESNAAGSRTSSSSWPAA